MLGTCEMSKNKTDEQIGVLQFVEIEGMEFKRFNTHLTDSVRTCWFVIYSF